MGADVAPAAECTVRPARVSTPVFRGGWYSRASSAGEPTGEGSPTAMTEPVIAIATR